MASAGWYPDPGGQQGMYRYWDGHAWSAATSANPSAPPPNQGLGGLPDQSRGQHSAGQYGQGQASSGQNPYGQNLSGQNPYGQNPYGQSAYQNYQQVTRKKRNGIGWWIGGVALLAVLIIVVVLVVRNVSGAGSTAGPGSQASQNACPTTTPTKAAQTATPDGRVHGGPVSYPLLPSPWSAPRTDDRVPFGSDVLEQTITIQSDYDGHGGSWVASVLVAQLLAGDGFFTPQQGSEIVAKCVVGVFYGDNPVQRHDEVSKAMKVDGHDAWYLKTHLTFDIPGLKTKGETAIIVIVNAGATSGLFYASIPDTSPQYLPAAEQSLKDLKVS